MSISISDIDFTQLHIFSNEPIIFMEIPLLGNIKIRCITKQFRKIDNAKLIQRTILDYNDECIFDSSEQIQELLSSLEIQKITLKIKEIIAEISPDINEMTANEISKLKDRFKNGFEYFKMELCKFNYVEEPSAYYGISLCDISDCQYLAFIVAKDIYADSAKKRK